MFSRSIQTGPGAHRPPLLCISGHFARVKSPDPEFDHSPSHLVPTLRISGAISLLPLYAFMSWTGTNLPFYLHFSYRMRWFLSLYTGVHRWFLSWAIWISSTRFPVTQLNINLLKPTGHVMHQQFNIQQLYVLPTLYVCVVYLSENKQPLVPLTA